MVLQEFDGVLLGCVRVFKVSRFVLGIDPIAGWLLPIHGLTS